MYFYELQTQTISFKDYFCGQNKDTSNVSTLFYSVIIQREPYLSKTQPKMSQQISSNKQ